MDNPLQRKPSLGFYIILSMFTFIYPLGAISSFLAWLNIRDDIRIMWQDVTLPLYVLVFLIGCVSIYGIWRQKKWGVYSLAGSWVLGDIITMVFLPYSPMLYNYAFLVVLLMIAFFLLLLPVLFETIFSDSPGREPAGGHPALSQLIKVEFRRTR